MGTEQVVAGEHPGRLAVVDHHHGIHRIPRALRAISTGSPAPTSGSGADMCRSTGSASRPAGEDRLEQIPLAHGTGHLARHHRRLGVDHRHLRDVVLARISIASRHGLGRVGVHQRRQVDRPWPGARPDR
jgi:hypothetical protein